MRRSILLLALTAIILTSCSTRYKTGQTPDDVYYAPTPKVDEAVVKNDKDKDEDKDRYEDYTSSQEDRYLRMKVRDRYRWSTIDDWGYWNDTRYYDSYYYGSYYPSSGIGVVYTSGWYNPIFSVGYNNHCCCYSNSVYNPYYTTGYIIKNPVHTVRPNLSTYSNTNYSNNNQGIIKKVFGSGRYSNSNSDNSSSSGRSYSPSSSSSSSSSSHSSGGGVSRPGRH